MNQSSNVEWNGLTDCRAQETLRNGELFWNISALDRGKPIEIDGRGVAPEDVRELLLQKQGKWVLQVAPTDRVALIRSIRIAFRIGQQINSVLLKGSHSYTGTRGEVQLLDYFLSQDQTPTQISRVE